MTGARIPAIVPVKGLRHAKQRLAHALTCEERQLLVLAMLADMLDTLSDVEAVGPTLVVTPDPEVAALARARNGTVLVEPAAAGLIAAVRRGLADKRVQAAGRALVLPGDVPLASAGEIAKVAASAAQRGRQRVTLVPSRDGHGTNALLLAPPDVIELGFGENSFVRHLAATVARRIDAEVLQVPGLATDIDEAWDLDCLLYERRWSRRYEFLRAASLPATITEERT
jgi:2-phospho-L-lactate/phosphoenolpyruvate guanylyltransferase